MKRRKFNKVTDCGSYQKLETSNGVTFLIDTADLDLVMQSMWCVSATGYIVSRRNGRVAKLHRLLMGEPKSSVVDHKNGDKTDNRRSNLRITNNKENCRNMKIKKTNTSGFPGIRVRESGNYQVRITVNRKELHIGTFRSFDEAKEARIKAERKYYGEFAPSVGANESLVQPTGRARNF